MAYYWKLKNTNPSPPIPEQVPGSESKTLQINSLGKAGQAFSNTKFIFLGNNHMDHNCGATLVAMMPEMQRAHVTILGLEGSGPSKNPFLTQLQDQIRGGHMSVEQIATTLQNWDTQHGLRPNFDAQATYLEQAKIISAATAHNIKVVGIDPRVEQGSGYIPGMSNYLSMDEKAAANAAHALATQPAGSVMAIFYGQNHITTPPIKQHTESQLGGGPPITVSEKRPITLPEALKKNHGPTVTVALTPQDPNLALPESIKPDYAAFSPDIRDAVLTNKQPAQSQSRSLEMNEMPLISRVSAQKLTHTVQI